MPPAELTVEVATAIKHKIEQLPEPPDDAQLRAFIERELDREASPLKSIFNQLAALLQLTRNDKENLWSKYLPITSRAIEQIILCLFESEGPP